MGFFKKRSKATSETKSYGDLGEVTMVVDDSGGVPKLALHLSRQAALGLRFQALQEQLGTTHPETREVAYQYAVVLAGNPGGRAKSIEILEWIIAAPVDIDPDRKRAILKELARLRR